MPAAAAQERGGDGGEAEEGKDQHRNDRSTTKLREGGHPEAAGLLRRQRPRRLHQGEGDKVLQKVRQELRADRQEQEVQQSVQLRATPLRRVFQVAGPGRHAQAEQEDGGQVRAEVREGRLQLGKVRF